MMASGSSNFLIKCKTENGAFVLKNLNSDSTVEELKMQLCIETGLEYGCVKILCGYPPKALAEGSDSLKLKDAAIHSGETIIIEKKNINKSESKLPSPGAIGNNSMENMEKAEQVALPRINNSAFQDNLAGGIMLRHVVPSNNSCLFASVYFVLSHGDLNPDKSFDLRKVIARVVSGNPEKYNPAVLGMSNADYCAWITNPDNWGGAIELSILSEHFGLEIVAVDTISLKMHVFGESAHYDKRIFLIYDGIHYDPLVLELGDAPLQTIFLANDDRPMDMAMEIAREAKSSRQYTDVANFSLRCMVCDERLKGDKEARVHAQQTGHTNFGEITK